MGCLQQLIHMGISRGLVARVSKGFLCQQSGKAGFRFRQGVPQGKAQMHCLLHGGNQRMVDHIRAGRNIGVADKACTYALLHHGFHQQHVIRFKGNHRLKSRFPE